MNFKKIGTKMLVMILPVLVLAQIVLTIMSATSSNALVDEKTQQAMEAELKANNSIVGGYLRDVKTLADAIVISVADSYTYTQWDDYEKMLQDMIATNDIVLGSGLWFEPYAYDPEQQYYGPYVYKDGNSTVTTWDYSNAEYDYFNQEYYTNAMGSDVAMITDPYYDPSSGIVMSSCSTPIVAGGKKIGCVTVDIQLTAITDIIANVKVGKTGVGILTAANGLLIAGHDDQMVQDGKSVSEDSNPSFVAMAEDVLKNPSGVTGYQEGKTNYKVFYDTIEETGWKFMISIDGYELLQPIYLLINRLVLVCIVAVCIAIIIIIIGIGGVAKTIKRVQKFATELAGGDFTVDQLSIKGKDELAIMSNSLNEMYGNNKGVIQSISDYAVEINESSSNLKYSAGELKTEFDKIVDIMTSVNADMMNSSAATEELSASVDQVAQSADNLNEETKNSLDLAIDIEKRATDIGKNSQEAFDKSQTLQASFQEKLEESISQSQVVENIGEMASVIADIADQITLLSLNASIEAARAGEQGKGFAVVATEIGKLAGQTSDSVEKIQETISAIKDAFEGLSTNAKSLLDYVSDTVTPDYKNFVGVAERYGQDAENIKNSSEQLSIMTDSIQNIMSEVRLALQNIAEATQNTAANSGEVMDSIDHLSGTVSNINDMSDEQNSISDNLSRVVSQFKLSE
ncbi:methyl-accepting chemotaxis protein [Pseudobutyrivibrio xylanivorans]|uniref:Methyl-accepting chemotaxis sensory transducer with Cache sensor n=1 Tax=Pseudobutyrivibrio xylanivorans DSM 14809 TaxID=1123012 RepID=A0A1M6FEW4_PSEXY|nr:methyl-accepting chemotaxis protein [Pseudobutyrivibrio xylanivorans]SHI96264.1 methyl-accepting chemotaxis sensory transducer with Cache sensor [Pseudobutyrivibrio xylanivorans DSM 14809]